MDCRPLRKGASEDEKRDGMQSDYDSAERFMLKYRPNIVLRGNHDERLYHAANQGSGIMREWAEHSIEELRKLFVETESRVFPYNVWDGVYRLGPLAFIHGYTHGMNPLPQPMASYGNVIMGHVHYPSYVSRFGTHGWTVACGCDVDLDYNSKRLTSLAQSNGWLSGEVNLKTGDYRVTPTIYRGKPAKPKAGH